MKLRLSMAIVILLLETGLAAQAETAAQPGPAETQTGATGMTTEMMQFGDKSLAFNQSGSGPAVVIVHGVGGQKEDWAGVAAVLATTHTVFAIDMLGFGQSSKTGDDLSMPVQAAAIKALLDNHNIAKADMVGNSVGGWVAATFAATYPDTVGKLVLIDAAGFKAMFEGPPPGNFDPETAEEMDKLIRFVINSKVADTPGLAQQAFDAYVASGEKAIAATWGKSLFISPRLEDLFPKVSAATLVLWGADDRLFPSALCDVFAAQIVGAACQQIPAAGHFPQIDHPEATIAAIAAFLK